MKARTGLDNWVGKASDDKKRKSRSAPEILAKYAGTYDGTRPLGPRPSPENHRNHGLRRNTRRRTEQPGKGELSAQSNTNFTGFFGWGINFVTDGQGVPTHLLEMHISGNYRFRRKQ